MVQVRTVPSGSCSVRYWVACGSRLGQGGWWPMFGGAPHSRHVVSAQGGWWACVMAAFSNQVRKCRQRSAERSRSRVGERGEALVCGGQEFPLRGVVLAPVVR